MCHLGMAVGTGVPLKKRITPYYLFNPEEMLWTLQFPNLGGKLVILHFFEKAFFPVEKAFFPVEKAIFFWSVFSIFWYQGCTPVLALSGHENS